MSAFRSYGYTGRPDSCIHCGRRLRHEPIVRLNPEYEKAVVERAAKGDLSSESFMALPPVTVKVGVARLGGPMRDGLFDSLRCAYSYAVAMAKKEKTA